MLTISSLLLNELQLRKKSNASYSQRAFARDLDISPGFLSHILKGEKNLSIENALSIAEKLKWSIYETQLLVTLSRYQSAQSKQERDFIKKEFVLLERKHHKFDALKPEQFTLVSKWYHMAILELIDTKDFQLDPTWIAKRLAISTEEAKNAIESLKNLQMIEVGEDNLVKKLKNNRVHDTTSTTIQQFHQTHLKKASQAIEDLSPKERLASGLSIAIAKKDIPLIYTAIHEFRSQISNLVQRSDLPKDRVYHLAVQFYPLDTDIKIPK